MRSAQDQRRSKHKRAPKGNLLGSCFQNVVVFELNQLRASPLGYVTSSRRRDKYTKFSPLRLDGIPSVGCRVPTVCTRIYNSALHLFSLPSSLSTLHFLSHPRPVNRNISQRQFASTIPLLPYHSCLALLAPSFSSAEFRSAYQTPSRPESQPSHSLQPSTNRFSFPRRGR